MEIVRRRVAPILEEIDTVIAECLNDPVVNRPKLLHAPGVEEKIWLPSRIAEPIRAKIRALSDDISALEQSRN